MSAVHRFVSKILFSDMQNCLHVLVVVEIQFYVMHKNIPLCITRSHDALLTYAFFHIQKLQRVKVRTHSFAISKSGM